VASGLISGGAVGNLIDRAFRGDAVVVQRPRLFGRGLTVDQIFRRAPFVMLNCTKLFGLRGRRSGFGATCTRCTFDRGLCRRWSPRTATQRHKQR